MKFSLTVECKCGNYDNMVLKRTTNRIPDTGRIYEDYSSLTDSEFKNGFFSTRQIQENEVIVKCNECDLEHTLST